MLGDCFCLEVSLLMIVSLFGGYERDGSQVCEGTLFKSPCFDPRHAVHSCYTNRSCYCYCVRLMVYTSVLVLSCEVLLHCDLILGCLHGINSDCIED